MYIVTAVQLLLVALQHTGITPYYLPNLPRLRAVMFVALRHKACIRVLDFTYSYLTKNHCFYRLLSADCSLIPAISVPDSCIIPSFVTCKVSEDCSYRHQMVRSLPCLGNIQQLTLPSLSALDAQVSSSDVCHLNVWVH